jgi:hypothetical protein
MRLVQWFSPKGDPSLCRQLTMTVNMSCCEDWVGVGGLLVSIVRNTFKNSTVHRTAPRHKELHHCKRGLFEKPYIALFSFKPSVFAC